MSCAFFHVRFLLLDLFLVNFIYHAKSGNKNKNKY